MDSKSIIKIRKLVGKKEKQEVRLNFTHNAKLVIIDDYYFIEPPVLEIALDGCEEIEFDYLVYRRNDGVIDQMVTFIQNEKALKYERQMLTEKNAAHEVRIAKLGKELNDLQATVEYQAEKIRQLENWEKVLRQKLSVVNNSTHFDISKSTLALCCVLSAAQGFFRFWRF